MEFTSLSLFSSGVSDDQKSNIAKKLLAIKRKPKSFYKMGYPTPVPITEIENQGRYVEISDLVGANSNFFFDKLDFDRSFLNLPVKEWKNDLGFLKMEQHVKNMRVSNDAAERGKQIAS